MESDSAPLSWAWDRRRRRNIFGFNVSSDCLGGLALLIGIPVLVAVHLATVVLTPHFTASQECKTLRLKVFVELLLCLSAEVLLFLLLVTDPGFVDAPTDLSCCCRHCGMEVEDFDHHCSAVGACIGKGNMCYFILFLLFAALLCVLAAVQNAVFAYGAVRAYRRDTAPSWTSRAALIDAGFTALRSPRTLCFLVLSVVAVDAGVVCTFLCLRYTYLAYWGLSSVRRRGLVGIPGSLSEVFAHTLRPAFSHNFTFPRDYALADLSE
ncbi:DHHC palmitoyltransferase, putative [Leishmania guyanensis]